ncbi:MAG: apolipoprotein N-acyltransferase [Phycisphaerae bacterium]
MNRRRGTRRKPAQRRPQGAISRPWYSVETHVGCILHALAAVLLMSVIFAPISWWPLSFVCLVPWLFLAGVAPRAPRVYFYSYVLALVFVLVNMRWLYPATPLGYLALSVYQAIYFPFMACAVRHVVRRRRWSLAVAFPFVWVGSEMLRAVVISGFPWFFLSHSLYKVLPLIQVSDLIGAYGVSFVVAAVNGALSDVAITASMSRGSHRPVLASRKTKLALAFAAALLAANTAYGWIRLRAASSSKGPKIALIQGDFLDTVYPDDVPEGEKVTDAVKMRAYLSMMQAASNDKPDLYLLPESPWHMYLNPEMRDLYPFWQQSFRQLRQFAIDHNAYVVTGSASRVDTPYDLQATVRAYNSATVFGPDGAEPKRYDKVHLVPFGEIVPFRFGRFHSVYLWLNSLMPFSGPDGTEEYSIFRGSEFRTFALQSASRGGATYHFGVPICYEDVMPYVSREFVRGRDGRKRADLLLNISNDGWFGRGIQQAQHLAISVFRAVENRVGIARAVNTGGSGFIEPTGRLHDVVAGNKGTFCPGRCGYAVASLGVDSRYSLYSRYGDWFGWACAFVWLVFFIDYWVLRARTGNGD